MLNADEKSFVSLLILDGEVTINGGDSVKAVKGDSVFVTASSGEFEINGCCKAILTKV